MTSISEQKYKAIYDDICHILHFYFPETFRGDHAICAKEITSVIISSLRTELEEVVKMLDKERKDEDTFSYGMYNKWNRMLDTIITNLKERIKEIK